MRSGKSSQVSSPHGQAGQLVAQPAERGHVERRHQQPAAAQLAAQHRQQQPGRGCLGGPVASSRTGLRSRSIGDVVGQRVEHLVEAWRCRHSASSAAVRSTRNRPSAVAGCDARRGRRREVRDTSSSIQSTPAARAASERADGVLDVPVDDAPAEPAMSQDVGPVARTPLRSAALIDVAGGHPAVARRAAGRGSDDQVVDGFEETRRGLAAAQVAEVVLAGRAPGLRAARRRPARSASSRAERGDRAEQSTMSAPSASGESAASSSRSSRRSVRKIGHSGRR